MVAIPFGIVLLIIVLLYIKSKKNENYIREIEDISKEEYPFKEFMPIGFLILDTLGIKRIKKLNNSTWDKLIVLYGIDVDIRSRAFYSNKFIYCLFSSLLVYAFQAANGKFSIGFILAGIVVPVILFYLLDTMLDEEMKKRSNSIKYDFPEFLSKLSLLINAGLTFEAAWQKILDSEKKKSILNRELKITINDINANIPRDVALRNFSRRCKVNVVTKFTNIVIQNINKGSSNLTIMLDNLGSECWIERQSYAKQKGEEASTKLLFPMMLMLISVFIITVVPAVLQMFGF